MQQSQNYQNPVYKRPLSQVKSSPTNQKYVMQTSFYNPAILNNSDNEQYQNNNHFTIQQQQNQHSYHHQPKQKFQQTQFPTVMTSSSVAPGDRFMLKENYKHVSKNVHDNFASATHAFL